MLGKLLHMGVIRMPDYRMYWVKETRRSLTFLLVEDLMKLNRTFISIY